MRIADAYNEFIRSREAMAATEHTLRTYRAELGPDSMNRRFLAEHGVTDTEQLAVPVLTELMAWHRDRGVSNNSLFSMRVRVGVFVNFCGMMGYCDADIMRRVPKPKVHVLIRRTHTEEEVRRMLETAADRRLYHPFDAQELTVMLLLFLDTGLRLGEMVRLDVGHFEGDLIKVVGKAGKERWVMISRPTRKAVDSYLELRHPLHPEQPLFINRGHGGNYARRGGRLTEAGLAVRLRRLGQAAGIQTSPHRWRHTFAAFSVRNGANLKALQLFLGHSNLATTDRYLQGFGFQDAAREHKVFSPVQRMVMQH
jgi:site-specific recombinase XerD